MAPGIRMFDEEEDERMVDAYLEQVGVNEDPSVWIDWHQLVLQAGMDVALKTKVKQRVKHLRQSTNVYDKIKKRVLLNRQIREESDAVVSMVISCICETQSGKLNQAVMDNVSLNFPEISRKKLSCLIHRNMQQIKNKVQEQLGVEFSLEKRQPTRVVNGIRDFCPRSVVNSYINYAERNAGVVSEDDEQMNVSVNENVSSESNRDEEPCEQPELARGLVKNCTTKYDGILGIAKDWNFLAAPNRRIKLPRLITISRKSAFDFKGISAVGKGDIVLEIYFTSESVPNLRQILILPGHQYVELKEIRSSFIQAVDKALMECPDTQESRLFDSVRSYASFIKKRPQGDSSNFNIECSDVYKFGQHFNEAFRVLLQQADISAVTYTAISYFGQSCEIRKTPTFLSNFLCQYFEEYVIHYAKDFEPMPGKALLWSRKNVIESMNGKSPEYEFYPGMLASYGNFYFPAARVENKEQQQDHEQKGNASVVTVYTKFYSRLCATAHKATQKPFKKPVFAPYLAGYDRNEKRTEADFVGSMKTYWNAVEGQQDVSVRFEVIIGNRDPKRVSEEEMRAQFCLEVDAHTMKNEMVAFEMAAIRDHMKFFMQSSLQTIEKMVKRKLELDDKEKLAWIATENEIRLTMIAEGIVCFLLYGVCLFYRPKEQTVKARSEPHDHKLLTAIGLKKQTFRDGPLHKAKKCLKLIHVSQDGIFLKPALHNQTNQTTHEKIEAQYFPNFGVSCDEMKQFGKALLNISAKGKPGCLSFVTAELALVLKHLWEILEKHLLKSPRKRTIGFNRIMKEKIEKAHNTREISPGQIISAADFVKCLFEERSSCLTKILTSVISIARDTIPCILYNFAVFLNNKMYENGSLIYYEVQGAFLLVFPFDATSKYSLARIERNVYVSLKKQFSESMKLCYGTCAGVFQYITQCQEQTTALDGAEDEVNLATAREIFKNCGVLL